MHAGEATLPLYIDSKEIARVIGFTPERVRRLLRRNGADIKRGNGVLTTRHKLREAFPEIYDELMDRLVNSANGDAK